LNLLLPLDGDGDVERTIDRADAIEGIMSPSMTHPFLSHLVAVLSVYELGPNPTPLPRYDGPRDWQTDAIERSLSSVARRMYTAEDQIATIKANNCAGPDTKKRRSGGDTPMTPNSLDDMPRTLNGNGYSDSDAEVTPQPKASPMSICLDDLPPIPDPSTKTVVPASAPATISQASEYFCPTCGRSAGRLTSSSHAISPTGSPLVVPPGPLSAAAFESGMSAVEELRLLKAQVQDVARVCKVRRRHFCGGLFLTLRRPWRSETYPKRSRYPSRASSWSSSRMS
jgi:osomolarity two-component system sensor histidine kinase NIK1